MPKTSNVIQVINNFTVVLFAELFKQKFDTTELANCFEQSKLHFFLIDNLFSQNTSSEGIVVNLNRILMKFAK